jgi:hypothetical protein
VGTYHTHGDYAWGNPFTEQPVRVWSFLDIHNSDNFSFGDKLNVWGQWKTQGPSNFKGYLGTPSGQFKVFEPNTAQTHPLN